VPGDGTERNGPPAAWVQRSVPISPAPVVYSQPVGMPPVAFGAPPAPVMELGAPGEAAPSPFQSPPSSEWHPALVVPPAPQAQAFPPLAPPAETPPVPTADTAMMQAKLAELSAQIDALDRRTQEQAQALDAARSETQTARQMTQRLETEFNAWRTELNLVRDAIREQSTADLQALDELNSALEGLMPVPASPDPFPSNDTPQMATGRKQGVRR